MEQNKPFDGCEGRYTYNCKDIDSAHHKLIEIEEIMKFFKKINNDYDYTTVMKFAPEGRVIIEVNIFK